MVGGATPSGDRLGYGALASYAEGVGDGVAVLPGRPLGTIAGWVRIAWERGGRLIEPVGRWQNRLDIGCDGGEVHNERSGNQIAVVISPQMG